MKNTVYSGNLSLGLQFMEYKNTDSCQKFRTPCQQL